MGEISRFRLGLISWDHLLEVDFKDVSIFGFVSKDLFKGSISGRNSFQLLKHHLNFAIEFVIVDSSKV